MYSLICITDDAVKEEPRVLGLAMVPGHHIVSIEVDESQINSDSHYQSEEEVL